MPISMVTMRMKCDKNVESLALFRVHNGPSIIVGVLFFIEVFAMLEVPNSHVLIASSWYFSYSIACLVGIYVLCNLSSCPSGPFLVPSTQLDLHSWLLN